MRLCSGTTANACAAGPGGAVRVLGLLLAALLVMLGALSATPTRAEGASEPGPSGSPSEPAGLYVLDWEDPAQQTVPAQPPPGWAAEYHRDLVHANGEPALRLARAAAGEPVRAGQHAARFQLDRGDRAINNGARAELSAHPSEPRGAERWYGFSTYLPPDYRPDQAAEVIAQWHQVGGDCSNGCSPPLSLITRNGQYAVSQNWEITRGNWHFHSENIGAYETGRWTDWVVHVKWSTESDGLLEIWRDGEPVPGFAPRVGRNDDYGDRVHGNYMKVGLYKWAWSQGKPSDTQQRVLFFDELRIAGASGSYEQVAPGSEPAPPGGGSCVTATAGGPWLPTAFTALGPRFEARMQLTPDRAPLDAEVALTRGPAAVGNFPALAVTVRFSPAGVIDARAGDRWVASSVRYEAGRAYAVRIAVDLASHRYSAWVTPPGGTEQVIGLDLPFRTEQQSVETLDTLTTLAVTGQLQACDLAVRPLPDASAPTVAAAGDIACDPDAKGFDVRRTCAMAATSDLLLASDPDAVLALGDLQYTDGALHEFRGSYDPTWGRLRERTRPVPGNHEYATPGAAGYFDYFGAAAGNRSDGYYSFDLGSWHVVALNSNCGAAGGCGPGSPQERWLRADLAAHPTACTLAFMHHPLYSSGSHGGTQSVRPLWAALQDAGAEVVLAGHDHNYERFAPQGPDGDARRDGLRQFVIGTGGAHLRDVGAARPHSEVRHSASHGVLELALHPDRYTWAFRSTTGAVVDRGETFCQGREPQHLPQIDLRAHVDRFLDGVSQDASQTHTAPQPHEADALTRGLREAAAGRTAKAAAALAPVGYIARDVRDTATGEHLVLVEEAVPPGDTTQRHWGLAILRPGQTPPNLLEVPHPVSETAIERLAVESFHAGMATGLLIAGTDRRADNPAADAAHAQAGAFEVVHRALLAPRGRVVQLHGYSTANHAGHPDHGDVVVSSGTTDPGQTTVALARDLEQAGFEVCLYRHPDCLDLGGTRNVQGASTRAHGSDFVHLEVARAVRTEPQKRSLVAHVISRQPPPAPHATRQ